MDLLKTGIGITKTIKNVARLREILTVFGKNGFDEFIIKFNLHTKIPGFVLPRKKSDIDISTDGMDIWESVGYRLRKSFEELGPSFVKLGQLLSTREDIFAPGFIRELKFLQNEAHGLDFSLAREVIEANIGKSIEEVFEYIDEEPIGRASIGVVYQGKLIDGPEVVIKVRRPRIKKLIFNDFEIISFLVAQIEKSSEEIRYLGISRAIDDFFNSIRNELNFLIESQNCQKLKKNLERIDEDKIFVIPKIFTEYTSEEILVMEHLNGRPFNTIKDLAEAPELEKKLLIAVKHFIRTMLADGFFHADLHGGNFFLLKDGRIGIIDFGLMGTLSKKSRMNLVAMLYALVTNNYENLVFEFLDVADYEVIPDHEALTRDVQDAVSPFIGLDLQDIDATQFVHALVSTLSKHQIYLPREWFIIFRALITLDGVGKSLGINLNIFDIIDGEIQGIVSDLVSKESMMEEAMWMGRDLLNSMRIVPRHLKWVLREFSKKKYKIDIRIQDIEKEMHALSRVISFVGLQVFSSTLIFSGVFMLKESAILDFHKIPVIIWLFWGAGLMIFLQSLILLRRAG